MQILLLSSSDPSLLSHEVIEATNDFVGDEDRNSSLSTFSERDYLNQAGHKDIGVLVDAAQTPPMLASKRVVVGRDLAFFGSTKAAFGPLLAYLENPSPTTAMILVWEKGPTTPTLPAVPTSLSRAVKDIGGEYRRVGGMRGREASDWFDQQIHRSGVRLDGRARSKLSDWMGEEPGRLAGVLEILKSTFGTDEILTEDQVAPFLTQAGTVPIWDLTDAIDEGDRAKALSHLRRIMSSEGGEPIRLIFSLHRHYEELMKLEGSGARTQQEAADKLALPKNRAFLAKRRLAQTELLGSEKIARCINFLAEADLDIRGRTGIDPEITMEVLVARLASQTHWRR